MFLECVQDCGGAILQPVCFGHKPPLISTSTLRLNVQAPHRALLPWNLTATEQE